jgi:hypothetical protein
VKSEIASCRTKAMEIISTSLQLYRLNTYDRDVDRMINSYYSDVKDYVACNILLCCYHTLAAELYITKFIVN